MANHTQEQMRRYLASGDLREFESIKNVADTSSCVVSLVDAFHRTIRFAVDIEPIGAPRMTQSDKWKKRPCVIRYREAKDAIRGACPEVIDPCKVESLSWVATFGMPKSWTKKQRSEMAGQLHRSRPDRDNVDKLVLDSLFAEDSAIAQGTLCKRWGNVGSFEIVIVVGK